MVPLTLLFYGLGAYTLSVFSRSVFPALAAYVVFHSIFYYPIFGSGALTDLEYITEYAVITLMYATAGYLFAWAFNNDNLFRFGTQSIKSLNRMEYLITVVLVLLGYLALALPFEFIPFIWGGGITLGLAAAVSIIGYMVLRKYGVMQAKDRDQAWIFFIWMGSVYGIVIVPFWLVFYLTSFDQFYMSLILSGSLIIIFAVARYALFGAKFPRLISGDAQYSLA
jgi:hypothetical protein